MCIVVLVELTFREVIRLLGSEGSDMDNQRFAVLERTTYEA